jgi:hypothetical protein
MYVKYIKNDIQKPVSIKKKISYISSLRKILNIEIRMRQDKRSQYVSISREIHDYVEFLLCNGHDFFSLLSVQLGIG